MNIDELAYRIAAAKPIPSLHVGNDHWPEVDYARASFHTVKMALADLAETKLPTCSLAGSRLREADLSSADLTDADLTNCDLFQTNLHGATLAGADLTGAEVSGLNLLTLADFKGV